MKLALINGLKSEAIKGAIGICPICESELIAKCGDLKMHHWAHKGNRNCDPWWENETDWHRSWKNKFPIEWQEVVHHDKNGEKHIADIKTPNEWVIEFQHSFLNPEERRARNAFYGKLIWVVDGTRRKRDKELLTKALNNGTLVGNINNFRRVRSADCALLREWIGSSPVFFDFGGEKVLWWLLGVASNGMVYIGPFSCSDFIEIHRVGLNQKVDEFNNFVKDISGLIRHYESSLQRRR
jgi:hypothetical protein